MPFLKKKFLIIAHRGAMKDRPQNTRSSFDRALACGADGIEFDVQLSADGVPVIYHDRSMRRINGSHRRLSDFSLKELRLLDWGSWYGEQYKREPLLTFREVLELYAGRCGLFVEIKSRKSDRASGRSQVLTHTLS
jgi:glycerophosphoryl diester phosphodiesterase